MYAAESQVTRALDRAARGACTIDFFGSTLTLPPERRFADIASVQRWVDEVLALSPVTALWPGVPGCSARPRAGAAKAHYEPPATIALPVSERWALRELVLCHELAHHLTEHTSGPAVAGHGREFVDSYLALTELVIGSEVALLLRAGLDEVGAV